MAVVSQQGTLQVTDPLSSNGWFGWVLSNISYSGNSSTGIAPVGSAITRDSDGNLYYSATVFENSMYIDVYVIKIDSAGNMIWEKRFRITAVGAQGVMYVRQCLFLNNEFYIHGVFYNTVQGTSPAPSYSYRHGVLHIDKTTGDLLSEIKIWDGNSNYLSAANLIMIMKQFDNCLIQRGDTLVASSYIFSYSPPSTIPWRKSIGSISPGGYWARWHAGCRGAVGIYVGTPTTYYPSAPTTLDYSRAIIISSLGDVSNQNGINYQNILETFGDYKAIKLNSVVQFGGAALVAGSLYKLLDPGVGGAGPSEGFFGLVGLYQSGANAPVVVSVGKSLISTVVGGFIDIYDVKVDSLGRCFGVGRYLEGNFIGAVSVGIVFRFDPSVGSIIWINKFQYYSRPGAVDGNLDPVITSTVFSELSVADTLTGGDTNYIYITGKTGYYPMFMKVPADGSLSYDLIDPFRYYLNSNPPPANFFPPQGQFSYDVFTEYTVGTPSVLTGSPPFALTSNNNALVVDIATITLNSPALVTTAHSACVWNEATVGAAPTITITGVSGLFGTNINGKTFYVKAGYDVLAGAGLELWQDYDPVTHTFFNPYDTTLFPPYTGGGVVSVGTNVSTASYPVTQASAVFTFENFPAGWVYQTQNLIQK